MLQHRLLVAQGPDERLRGLLDDRREGDCDHHAPQVVGLGVRQGEVQGGERLASACRDREAEDSRRLGGSGTASAADLGAHSIDLT